MCRWAGNSSSTLRGRRRRVVDPADQPLLGGRRGVVRLLGSGRAPCRPPALLAGRVEGPGVGGAEHVADHPAVVLGDERQVGLRRRGTARPRSHRAARVAVQRPRVPAGVAGAHADVVQRVAIARNARRMPITRRYGTNLRVPSPMALLFSDQRRKHNAPHASDPSRKRDPSPSGPEMRFWCAAHDGLPSFGARNRYPLCWDPERGGRRSGAPRPRD